MQNIFLFIAVLYSIFLFLPIKEVLTGAWLKEWTNSQRHKENE